MLPGWGQCGLEPGVSLPPDHMFILQALIEEQHRLIFMERKIGKAGKGRGADWGRSLALVFDSRRPVAGLVPTKLLPEGVGCSACQGGAPLNFGRKALGQVSLF